MVKETSNQLFSRGIHSTFIPSINEKRTGPFGLTRKFAGPSMISARAEENAMKSEINRIRQFLVIFSFRKIGTKLNNLELFLYPQCKQSKIIFHRINWVEFS